MADYSQYQGPSQEWQEFVMTTAVPAAGPAAGQSVEEYQKATNQWRELNSARYMQVSGIFFYSSLCERFNLTIDRLGE
jgi:hypothetical protein